MLRVAPRFPMKKLGAASSRASGPRYALLHVAGAHAYQHVTPTVNVPAALVVDRKLIAIAVTAMPSVCVVTATPAEALARVGVA